jgi:hypothetical protein
MAFAALSTFFVTANAQTELPSVLKDLSVTGYVDMYYSYDFGKPMSGANVLGGSGRQFDVANNQFGFAALALNINKKITADNPFGFTIGVLLGKNADILNAFEPAGPNSSFKNLSQAYVSYAVPKSPVTVDLGKFLTWIGYEGLASADNDNYSRSFLYYYAQPVYHTGVRASGTLPGGLTAAVQVQPLPFAPLERTLSLSARAGLLRDIPGQIALRLRGLLEGQVVAPALAEWPWLAGSLRVL